MTELEDKMHQAINDCPNSIGDRCEIMESSKVCAKIAVEEQISLLEKIAKLADNSRADYYIGLEIETLKSQL